MPLGIFIIVVGKNIRIAKLNFIQFFKIPCTRLKKAAALLAGGTHKIYEIIEMVGYNSQSNFTRSFQKQFSMTPTEYVSVKQAEKKQER